MTLLIIIAVAIIILFVVAYRQNNGEHVYKFVSSKVGNIYEKVAPYTFKEVRQKVKDLGQEYTTRQYIIQVVAFSLGAGVVGYLYFYNIIISIIYALLATSIIPY
ncbi:MAG: hypothetical protein RSB72_01845, partial [Bacilli bacterium]